MKKCRKCGEIKSIEAFYRHPRGADGHFNICKACVCEGQRARNGSAKVARAKWREENRSKIAAHTAVAVALAQGRLVRRPCEVCGEKRSEAHHDDHSKPLDVVWLCDLHHGERHRENRRSA